MIRLQDSPVQRAPILVPAGDIQLRAKSSIGIGVGDTVRVRYLTDDRKLLQVTISRLKNDPATGIIHFESPIARALLGAEEGDEVEVLVGSHVRAALVESITRAPN